MPGSAAIVSRYGKRLTTILLALAVLAGALTACSQRPSPEALKGPAKDVFSAVQATTLAVEIRIKNSTTAAAGSTAADDMLGEVESATDEVEGFTAPTEEEKSLRDDMLASFATVSRALLHARDALTAPAGSPQPSGPQPSGPEQGQSGSGENGLPQVLAELRSATDQLKALMTKAGIQ
ncbi:hypothetical protein StoSoilA2_37560 [Arthrobacter sp. StoSoilA2]|uniref:hypothetical protein n=1 Tax=Arthrobacter sp. StoSoilA2 TaxID=2830990 RepID=UPI001CC4E605|nr:hypothetical protein [Arthrobacter sp. StoSoilA2]BCW37700.1 hypothetical protein StoSoilA2_37560 [Arthrobacter sp. StoSoilA2]